MRNMTETNRVLITGGLGFIGSNLANELERRGHDVWICDIRHAENPKVIRCDVGRFRQVERLFEAHKFDYVYHAAAEYGRWNGEAYYENLWNTNAVGMKNILRLQEKTGFRMVFFGSAEVYGDYAGLMTEAVMDTVPIKQMNDYAIVKWANELQILNSETMFGTETVRVRLFNVYGPREHFSPYRGVVPVFIYKALHDQPYTVYLSHKRTFEYVEDICRTLGNVMDRFTPGEVYNLGSEQQYDIKQLSDLILRYLQKDDASVDYREAELFTTKEKRPDSSKAAKELNHRITVSLEQGVPPTIEWFKRAYAVTK